MRRFTAPTDDQIYRGNLVEAIFFEVINSEWEIPIPKLIKVERASLIADVRGVDGIVQCKNVQIEGIRRIPIQLKYGQSFGHQDFHDTHFGIRVPIIYLTLETTPKQMRHRIEELFMRQSVRHTLYERQLAVLENKRPTGAEFELMSTIRNARTAFTRERASRERTPAHV
jgi:hypothetical protein